MQIEKSEFQIGDEIRSGGQGHVYKAIWHGSPVAVKTMDWASFNKLMVREVALMQEIRHEKFVHIVVICPMPTKLNILMQFVDGKSLQEMIFKLPET